MERNKSEKRSWEIFPVYSLGKFLFLYKCVFAVIYHFATVFTNSLLRLLAFLKCGSFSAERFKASKTA